MKLCKRLVLFLLAVYSLHALTVLKSARFDQMFCRCLIWLHLPQVARSAGTGLKSIESRLFVNVIGVVKILLLQTLA